MQAIKNEVKRNAPVLFAVQLDWSVTPFDMAKVPPLAIFNAYTLYTTEANREGRTWYGLRLGFFSDAVSAKQVAYYVRSDFKTVSVVPVTTIEKERANDINAARSGIHRAVNVKEGPAPTPLSMTSSNASGVFKLLDDDLPEMIEQDVDGETSPRFSKPAALCARGAGAGREAAPLSPQHRLPSATSKASKGRKPGARGVAATRTRRWTKRRSTRRWKFSARNTLEITNDSAGNTGVRHLRVQGGQEGLEVRVADRSPLWQEISRARNSPHQASRRLARPHRGRLTTSCRTALRVPRVRHRLRPSARRTPPPSA